MWLSSLRWAKWSVCKTQRDSFKLASIGSGLGMIMWLIAQKHNACMVLWSRVQRIYESTHTDKYKGITNESVYGTLIKYGMHSVLRKCSHDMEVGKYQEVTSKWSQLLSISGRFLSFDGSLVHFCSWYSDAVHWSGRLSVTRSVAVVFFLIVLETPMLFSVATSFVSHCDSCCPGHTFFSTSNAEQSCQLA